MCSALLARALRLKALQDTLAILGNLCGTWLSWFQRHAKFAYDGLWPYFGGGATMDQIAIPPAREAIARPLYSQVREILLARISRGDWAIGETLPNEFKLSTEYGVSVGTIRRAVEGLEEAGIVVRRQGRGTYLAQKRHDSVVSRLNVLRLPNGTTADIIFRLDELLQRRPSDIEAAVLQLELNHDVYEVAQTLFIDDQIVGSETSVVTTRLLPTFGKHLCGGGPLYKSYAELNVGVIKTEDTIKVCIPDIGTARKLNTNGKALLLIERLSLTTAGQPVDFKRGWYLPEKVSYVSATV